MGIVKQAHKLFGNIQMDGRLKSKPNFNKQAFQDGID
jgi:hypothetical protein